MTKGFLKQAVRFFTIILIIPALVSCGSGGSSSTEKEPATPSSLSNDTTTPAPASTADQSTTDPGSTATPVSTVETPPASAVPGTPGTSVSNPPPAPSEPVPAEEADSPADTAAGWQALGGRVNAAQRGTAVWLTLSTIQNSPAIAWEEDGKIYAAFWNNTRWSVEGPLNFNPNEAASLPSLATDGTGLFLTWIEGRSLYLTRREGSGWTPVAVQAHQDGCGPVNAALDIRQGVPTVAWDSFCSDSRYASTRVQQWAGAWVDLGGAGEHYADAPSPRKYALGSHGENLSLAVLMQNASSEGIELALFNRTEESWLPVGGPANDPLAFAPSAFSLAFVQNVPTLAFQQGGIQAKQWNGEAWVTLGTSLSQDGVDPALMEVDGRPNVAFGGSSVEVWSWNGTAWTQKGRDLNQTSGAFSWSTSLAATGQRLYAAWIENGFIFVKTMPIQ